MKQIYIYLLCYNESLLLPETIKHYRHYLPTANITIYDNQSDDDSVQIAEKLGCNVISWTSDNQLNEIKQTDIKNNCWKSLRYGWVIIADMDEWLCVTESDLEEEEKKGTSILNTIGYDMIGESNLIHCQDIDLQKIQKGIFNKFESKSLCFLRDSIVSMNYSLAAHNSFPIGKIQYSDRIYLIKHMNYLGLYYIIDKMVKRYTRSATMREKKIALHYTNDTHYIRYHYYKLLSETIVINLRSTN